MLVVVIFKAPFENKIKFSCLHFFGGRVTSTPKLQMSVVWKDNWSLDNYSYLNSKIDLILK